MKLKLILIVSLLLLSACQFFPKEGVLVLSESGTIVKVKDADTFNVKLTTGKVITVRLLGIDFPDLDKKRIEYWKERGWTEEHVRACYRIGNSIVKKEFLGNNVTLFADTNEDNTDKYKRHLRYVWAHGDNATVNELLVATGWAVMRDWNYPECTLCPRLKELENQAKEKQVGCLWQQA